MPTIQPNEIEIISKLINNDSQAIDVGANHGEWTKEVLKRFPGALIHVYEANPDLIPEMEALEQDDNWVWVTIRNYAISDKWGTADFWIYNLDGMSGLYRRPPEEEAKFNAGNPEPHKITVETRRLDDFYDPDNKFSFIKIDTEGAEIPVIRGAKTLIGNNQINAIQFEYGLCWKENGFKLEEAFKLLKSFPYRYRLPENTGIIPVVEFVPDMEDYQYSNFVFSKAAI
jgi:FkbM family methyltransferase